ncbi:MAG: hypothetical protein M0Q91_12215 [Methanoregula sp.]|jgi:hypothetical protein|nr:hypothetical protein [Methanoregula sp.]
MIKIAYHATNHADEIRLSGKIIPARMKNVFLTEEERSAKLYAERMRDYYGEMEIVEVRYDTKDVERTWRPAYIDGGKVIKLKEGCSAEVVCKCTGDVS